MEKYLGEQVIFTGSSLEKLIKISVVWKSKYLNIKIFFKNGPLS
jgi:hypothetical protein